ncbi:deoxyguanosinetriphosphate triphosphohydrolase [Rugosimonospora acidiphila]|uniref:Deoxyguanosinetriphosphate triphosphohydrolase-like protein n=1 Tax=Rugosimonospora acidiphila TaxID=556531 RepID=A0ABP9RRT9_9ACTN
MHQNDDVDLAGPNREAERAEALHEQERCVDEPPKDTRTLPVDGQRTQFQRDRARVLHSAAFRRLAAKTQVHLAGSDDFLRTRLTHSLEVAQIGREMGAQLGCDPDVVDTAGLAHDLGHPPFGHNGEDALNEVAGACGGFEGNAQTLRVLTRLEAKVMRPDGTSAGLNLTRASLDACCKYPWPRSEGTRKFGVYPDDLPVFGWLRSDWSGSSRGAGRAEPDRSGGVPEGTRRCLEAQVMDWADDVAYSVHDVEDGIHGGYIALRNLRDDNVERAALCADVAASYSGESASDLAAVLDELLSDPVFAPLYRYDGSHASMVALKQVTSVLTGRFVAAAVGATRAAAGPGRLRRYAADLAVPRRTRAECALLKGLALRYVMRRPGAAPWYEQQREILVGLVDALARRAPHGLDPVFAPLWLAAPNDAARLRVIIDQVASLTDPAAISWHRRLVGGPAPWPGREADAGGTVAG